MAINLLSPSTLTTAFMVADTWGSPEGISNPNGYPSDSALPFPKALNGVISTATGATPISAGMCLHSVLGGLYLRPMTPTQIAALNAAPGLTVFNNSTQSLQTFTSNGSFAGNLSVASGTLTVANIQGMSAAPVQLLPAPGAGFAYIVNQVILENVFVTTAFANGGLVAVQYGNTALGAGLPAIKGALTTGNTALPYTGLLAATALTGGASSITVTDGSSGAVQATTRLITALGNLGIYISNQTQAFTGGGTSTVNWTIVYQIIAL